MTSATDILVLFAIGSLLVAIAITLVRLREAAQRERDMARERGALTAAYAQVAAARTAAESRASVLSAVMSGMSDGVIMFDRDMRLVQWNDRFAEIAGVPPEMMREGVTLEEMIRAQALTGEFGRGDMEAEVLRRTASVRRLRDVMISERQRPNGRVIELRRRALPDGSVVSLVTDVTSRRRTPAPIRAEPLAALAAVPQRPDPVALTVLPPRPPRRSIVLLVEDILVNQLVTATQLRREGHRVDVASTGSEAVRMVGATPYDLVLMDLMMPGMSGYEAAHEIRRMRGLSGGVPILALTANDSPQDRARCAEAGMQGMLSKPISGEELSAAISDLLRPGAARPESAPPDRLLDTERLAELREGLPPALFVSLAEQCIVDMRERMMDLHEAMEMEDHPRIVAAAHALAGMAGSYGMTALERRMRGVMAAATEGDIAACRALAPGMTEELDRSEEALQMLVQAPAPQVPAA